MRRRGLLATALLLGGCASSPFEGLTTLEVAGARVRLHAPGSVETRSAATGPAGRPRLPARSQPCVLMGPSGPGEADPSALEPLLQHRLTVLVLESPPSPETAARVAAWLRARPECRERPVGLLLSGGAPEGQAAIAHAVRPRALAMMVGPAGDGPEGSQGAVAVERLEKVLLLAATANGSRDAPLVGRVTALVGRAPVERWYAPVRDRLPREAGRDAAEWLAGELEGE